MNDSISKSSSKQTNVEDNRDFVNLSFHLIYHSKEIRRKPSKMSAKIKYIFYKT